MEACRADNLIVLASEVAQGATLISSHQSAYLLDAPKHDLADVSATFGDQPIC